MKKLNSVYIVALLGLVLTGCGEVSQLQPGNQVEQARTNVQTVVPQPNKKDLCKLLPPERVSQIVGVVFTSSEAKFLDERASVTDCTYRNEEGKSVSVIVNFDEEDNLAVSQYQALKDMLADEQGMDEPLNEVTGVGSAAFYSMTGFLTQLNAVNTGGNAWVTVAVTAPGGEENGKTVAKALANEIFRVLE